MVWVVEHIDYSLSHQDHVISVWDTEDAARKYVCAELMDILRQEVVNYPNNLKDPLFVQESLKISDHISNNRYKEAICHWNSSLLNTVPIHWYVFPEQIRDESMTKVPVPFGPNFFVTSEKEESETQEVTKEEFVASTPGATCRVCPDYNEYAYADQPDGTYVCRSCKMMNQVFGS